LFLTSKASGSAHSISSLSISASALADHAQSCTLSILSPSRASCSFSFCRVTQPPSSKSPYTQLALTVHCNWGASFAQSRTIHVHVQPAHRQAVLVFTSPFFARVLGTMLVTLPRSAPSPASLNVAFALPLRCTLLGACRSTGTGQQLSVHTVLASILEHAMLLTPSEQRPNSSSAMETDSYSVLWVPQPHAALMATVLVRPLGASLAQIRVHASSDAMLVECVYLFSTLAPSLVFVHGRLDGFAAAVKDALLQLKEHRGHREMHRVLAEFCL
jgi:hypothetical protein